MESDLRETKELYTRNPDFIFRKIVDEMILVPIHKDVADMDAIFTLNEVGAFVWAKIEQPSSLDKIQKSLADEFDADLEIIQSDLRQFLTEMVNIGAVVRS